MNANPNPSAALLHLSDDDLDDLLLGTASAACTAHAAACELCAQRLQSFRAGIATFNQASIAWSQARSNTLSRDLSTHRPQPWLTLAAARSYAAALLVVAAVMLTAGIHHRALATSASQARVGHALGSDELASDNALLDAIDSEIYRPVPVPAGLDSEVSTRRTHPSSPQARN